MNIRAWSLCGDLRRNEIVRYKRLNAQQAANTSAANISTPAMIS